MDNETKKRTGLESLNERNIKETFSIYTLFIVEQYFTTILDI